MAAALPFVGGSRLTVTRSSSSMAAAELASLHVTLTAVAALPVVGLTVVVGQLRAPVAVVKDSVPPSGAVSTTCMTLLCVPLVPGCVDSRGVTARIAWPAAAVCRQDTWAECR